MIIGEAMVDQMYAKHHRTAEASGAHIVPCAGFDSVPSDLGTVPVRNKICPILPGVPWRSWEF